MLLAAARKFLMSAMVAAREEEKQTGSDSAENKETLNGENHRVC